MVSACRPEGEFPFQKDGYFSLPEGVGLGIELDETTQCFSIRRETIVTPKATCRRRTSLPASRTYMDLKHNGIPDTILAQPILTGTVSAYK